MEQYAPSSFEKKWQERWESKRVYKSLNPGEVGFDQSRPSYYVLDMFPYPSGSGLHVGHASGYIGTDIIARRKRMDGCNVLHPMGWDAFGLPAEQYAIQTGQHPRVTTEKNSDTFKKQLKTLGLSYDWDREIDTSVPAYYKWTQWLFLKLYEKNLVYQKEVSVWWCEDLKTVLANEEVINGRSERGNHPCIRKPLKQWMLKITEYADRLIFDLKGLDWPDHIKKMQVDWIGRSSGVEIDFQVYNSERRIRVFSTRADTLFGVTALVLAPEHPFVKELTRAEQKNMIDTYISKVDSKSDRERKAKAISGAFLGSFAIHPFVQNKRIPIFIADYITADYGTGAVMLVPAHDERDYLFAKAYSLPLIRVIKGSEPSLSINDCYTGEGLLENSGEFSGLPSTEARTRIINALVREGIGEGKVRYKLKDWVFSRQRYWGEPFPMSFAPDGSIVPADESELPIKLPEMTDFSPSADGSAPLARVPEWVNHTSVKSPNMQLRRSTDTMPGWAGSCWYYLRFMDPHNAANAFSREAVSYWKQVDLYVGGTAHAVMHLLYSRFWHKVFYDCNLVPTTEPFKKLFNQGMVTAFSFKDTSGRLVPSDEVETHDNEWYRKGTEEKLERFVAKMSKSLRNVINPDDVIASHGRDVLRTFVMFMGPLQDEKPWADEGLSGCERFLKRIWNLFHDDTGSVKAHLLVETEGVQGHNSLVKLNSDQLAIEQAFHRCLQRVNDSFINFNFNTAVAAFMEFLNFISERQEALTRTQAENFLKIISPFCPHIAAELWERLGNMSWIDFEPWPDFDQTIAEGSEYQLVLSVNGRLRKRVQVARQTDSEALEKLAKEQLAEFIARKPIVKVIVVPDKLVNLVIEE